MYKQPTSDEYDLALLIAGQDLAINNFAIDSDDVVKGEFITKKAFLKDLKKASQRIEKLKPSPKRS